MKVYVVTAEEFCGERRIVKVLSELADANKLVDMSQRVRRLPRRGVGGG